MQTTVYHVVPKGDQWAVKREGATQASRVLEDRSAAVEQAESFARNQAPSRVIVHEQDGSIEFQHTFDREDRPTAESEGFQGLLRHPAAIAGAVTAIGLIGLGVLIARR